MISPMTRRYTRGMVIFVREVGGISPSLIGGARLRVSGWRVVNHCATWRTNVAFDVIVVRCLPGIIVTLIGYVIALWHLVSLSRSLLICHRVWGRRVVDVIRRGLVGPDRVFTMAGTFPAISVAMPAPSLWCGLICPVDRHVTPGILLPEFPFVLIEAPQHREGIFPRGVHFANLALYHSEDCRFGFRQGCPVDGKGVFRGCKAFVVAEGAYQPICCLTSVFLPETLPSGTRHVHGVGKGVRGDPFASLVVVPNGC